MFNKNSNKSLWIVFAILLVAVILVFTSESTKKERSFRKDIVSIDTSSVTSFSLFPKSLSGKEVKFVKNNGTWSVSGEDNKYFSVPFNKIRNLFNQLIVIKPKRVASKSEKSWKEYEVDSSATRVVVNEGSSEVLNLVIGKFLFQQPRSMSTFVRVMDEDEVYEVDGFLDMSFNKDVNSFRNENVVVSNITSWNKLSFSYTNGESFDLIREDNKWQVNGETTDSSKTVNVLNSLSRITSTNFIDNLEANLLPSQTSKLTIHISDGSPIEVTGFQNESQYLIKTSQNEESLFDAKDIADKLFIKKENLF